MSEQTLHKTITWLAYAGLLPFIVSLILILLSNNSGLINDIRHVLIVYAALILSFIAAMHWGFILKVPVENVSIKLIFSAAVVILAWLSILIPPIYSLGMLFFSFIGLYRYERSQLWQDYFPEWYQELRARMSFLVSASLLIIWIMSFIDIEK